MEKQEIVTEINSHDDLLKIMTKFRFVIIDYKASWCGPCIKLTPIFKEVAEKISKINKNIKFISIDVDKVESDVRAMPTIRIFINGKVINENVGFITKENLEKFILNSIIKNSQTTTTTTHKQ